MATEALTNESYTIGWVCALEIELAAAQGLLDQEHPDLPVADMDSNTYLLGSIGHHNVVIATLPSGRPGTTPAAVAATNLLRSFPNIRFSLMVGVGGGAPGKPQADSRDDIRLGDVVVGHQHGAHHGVLQYDFGKTLHDGNLVQTGFLNHMPTPIGTALARLRASTRLKGYRFPAMVDQMIKTYPDAGFKRPIEDDQLFAATYHHAEHEEDNCSMCKVDETIQRQPREKPNIPKVHFGTIGSANQVLRNPSVRDKLHQDFGVLCIEMEAGGLMNDFPCIVIRGICDYCDSHKNKQWQPYAAAVAAAFSKELLQTIAPAIVAHERLARKVINTVEDLSQATRAMQASIEHISRKTIMDGLVYARGATFDAFNDVDELDSRCLEGTRSALLQQIRTWIVSPDSPQVFWLNGAAGTGKSTIARTVAAEFQASQQLGASFFFKRGEADRGNASRFFPTIARQLASSVTGLSLHIKDALENDPDIVEKALREQFESLILQPFVAMDEIPAAYILLVVDALDECDGDENVKLIINLLSRTIAKKTIRILVTSRPELPVRLGFSRVSASSYQNLILQEIPADIVKHDLSIYLQHRFAHIQSDHKELPSEWPGKDNIRKLADLAYPLFIIAATICRFVDDPHWQPQAQLEHLLQFKHIEGNEIERAYNSILSRYFQGTSSRQTELIHDFKAIVGPIVVVMEPLHINALASLLRIDRTRISNRLKTLHSVLSVPPHEMVDTPVKILHLSFADFLLDRKKSRMHQFWIDEGQIHFQLTRDCLELLSSSCVLRQDMCDLQHPGSLRKDIRQSKIHTALPTEVQYACKYWVYHAERCPNHTQSLEAEIYTFLKHRFLYWFEAMSLLGQATEMIYLINKLSAFSLRESALAYLVYDARRFVLTNIYIVDIAPLQLYSSCIIFAPDCSLIKSQAALPSWLDTEYQFEETWSATLQTLEGHSTGVRKVIWSPDDKVLASGAVDGSVKLWDASSGRLMQTLEGHSDRIEALAFSPVDGVYLASSSGDGTLQLWDASSGELRRTLEIDHDRSQTTSIAPNSPASDESEDHFAWVQAMAYTPDGQSLIRASGNGIVKLWQIHSGHVKNIQIDGFDKYSPGQNVAVSKGAEKLAVSMLSIVRVWDLASRTLTHTFQSFRADSVQFNDITFSPDVRTLAIAEDDSYSGNIMLLDLVTAKVSKELSVFATGLLTYACDGKKLAGNVDGLSLWIWDFTAESVTQVLRGHTSFVSSLSFSHDSKAIASGSADNTVRLWDLGIKQHPATVHSIAELRSIESLTFSPDGRLLVSSHRSGCIKFWDVTSKRPALQQTEFPHAYWVTGVVFSSDGKFLVSYCPTEVTVWHQRSRRWTIQHVVSNDSYDPHNDRFGWKGIASIYLSTDNKLLAFKTNQSKYRIWDIDKNKDIQTLQSTTICAPRKFLQQAGYNFQNQSLDPSLDDPNNGEKTRLLMHTYDDWVTRNYKKLLWIPPNYRGEFAIYRDTVAIGLPDDRIILFQLSNEELDKAGY